MTKAQQARIDSLVARMTYLENPDGNRPVKVFVESMEDHGSFVSVTIRYKRTDCEEYSPRMVLCSGGYHFHIGRGGASKLTHGYSISDEDLSVVARLYRSTTFHYKPSKAVLARRCAHARTFLSK